MKQAFSDTGQQTAQNSDPRENKNKISPTIIPAFSQDARSSLTQRREAQTEHSSLMELGKQRSPETPRQLKFAS